MGRRVLIALALLVLAGGGLFFWLGQNLNGLVKRGVETYGPRVTGTPVRLAGVDLALREGRGTLRGLRIGNPEGFSGDDAISLGEITLDVDPASLTRDPIVVEALRITGPELLVELGKGGSVNMKKLQSTVEAYAPEPSRKPPPRVAVKEVTVSGGRLVLDATAVGGERKERELEGFTLRNIGGEGGVPADRLGQEVVRALLGAAMERGMMAEMRDRAGGLAKEAGGLLEGLRSK